MQDLDQFKQTYFQECEELLGDMEGHLLALDARGGEALHAIFRAVHSIKGGAGAFGFQQLVGFAHILETVFDRMRDGEIKASADLVVLLLRAGDLLADLVRAARAGESLPDEYGVDVQDQLRHLAEAPCDPGDDADIDFIPIRADVAPSASPEVVCGRWHIRLTPKPDMLAHNNDPLLLIRELQSLGPTTVVADLAKLPPLGEMQATAAYLSWDIEVETGKGLAAIEEVFDFVGDDCHLLITPLGVPLPTAAVEPVMATKSVGAAPLPPAALSMRVDLDKVDRLVNMVGELAITQAMLAQAGGVAASGKFPELSRGLEELQSHTRELQDSVMAIRAQPIKAVFQRAPRQVRELAAQLGKRIALVVTGENTEIDKTVIETLADPLTHLIRNACDHGLETPEERLAAGKPEEGTIWLSAEHRGGRVCIQIAEDGRGIDRARVLERAIDKGLVPRGALMTPEDIDDIIFLPGFSTATAVSDVSGRGVGLDVVQRNILALGGRISVTSVAGRGTSFLLSLPLTLAVVDGMIVRVGSESYVLPLSNIVECLRPLRAVLHSVVGRGEVVDLRSEYVPLIYLHRIFRVDGAQDDPTKAVVVVAEGEDGAKIGIVVDELLGQQQVVIKSLEANYTPVPGVAAATILGDGRVALILDIGGLRDMARSAKAGSR